MRNVATHCNIVDSFPLSTTTTTTGHAHPQHEEATTGAVGDRVPAAGYCTAFDMELATFLSLVRARAERGIHSIRSATPEGARCVVSSASSASCLNVYHARVCQSIDIAAAYQHDHEPKAAHAATHTCCCKR